MMFGASSQHSSLPSSNFHANIPSTAYEKESGNGLLAELDKIAPLKSFDAFPKVQSSYKQTSTRGGLVTVLVSIVIFLLVLNDLGEYLYGESDYTFAVDHGIGKDLQLNVDMTIAMPCHFLSIDLRDAVGDRLFLSNDFQKDGTTFNPGPSVTAFQSSTLNNQDSSTSPSASKIVSQAKTRSSGLFSLFSGRGGSKKLGTQGYRKTRDLVEDGDACRIYGSVEVKKVTANFHVTTLGHGYMSYEHTDHSMMNLSHIIHEWSFGPYYPKIAQPLDMSMEITTEHFSIFQYFLTVVPTTYHTSSNKIVSTNQYSVTDYVRHVEHGRGVPGIFFKYDLDALALTIRERTTSLRSFLVRLAGVIGGVWVCTGFFLRVISRAELEVKRAQKGKGRELNSGIIPSTSGSNGHTAPGMMRRSSGSWVGGGNKML